MPVGGKLVLKGGLQVTSSGVEKKKKKKRKDKEASAGDDTGMARLRRVVYNQGLVVPCSAASHAHPVAAKAAAAITTQGDGAYEQVFSLEMEKARAGKVKNTPWGSSFRAPPQVLHGAPCSGWRGQAMWVSFYTKYADW